MFLAMFMQRALTNVLWKVVNGNSGMAGYQSLFTSCSIPTARPSELLYEFTVHWVHLYWESSVTSQFNVLYLGAMNLFTQIEQCHLCAVALHVVSLWRVAKVSPSGIRSFHCNNSLIQPALKVTQMAGLNKSVCAVWYTTRVWWAHTVGDWFVVSAVATVLCSLLVLQPAH